MRKLVLFFMYSYICSYSLVKNLYAFNEFYTSAKSAIVLEYSTGNVLFAKNTDKKIFPASLTKLMTLYIVFDYLKNNKIKLNTKVHVSSNSYLTGGTKTGSSTMFLEPNTLVSVEDLIHGIATVSGNDACIAIAEAIAGSELNFTNYMNIFAKKLGLKNTHFTNSTGWPEENHYSTVYDIALLSKHIIFDFPEYYHFFNVKQFTYNKVTQNNRNLLLFDKSIYVDGLKTGHTEKSGYSLAFSSVNEKGIRIIGVVYGLKSSKERTIESKKLISWIYFNLGTVILYKKGDFITKIPVLYGSKSSVNLYANEDIVVFYNKNFDNISTYKATLIHNNILLPPLKLGDTIAKIKVENILNRDTSYFYNFRLDQDITKNGFIMRFFKTPYYLVKKLFN